MESKIQERLMNITESQLRKIIKESIEFLIKEQEETVKASEDISKLEVDTSAGKFSIEMDGETVKLSDDEGNTIRGPEEVEEAIGAMVIVTDGKGDKKAKETLSRYIKKLFPKENSDQSYDALIKRLKKFGSSLLNR